VLALLKLLKSLVQTLHSDGSPRQIAAGIMLGSCLGLTPLMNAHNAVIVILLCVLNVSFAAGMLGWLLFVPIGFLLDPLFDMVGRALLVDSPSLTPLWTRLDAMPLVPYTNFNNTVVLGSVVSWIVLAPLIYAGAYIGVLRYRATLAPKVERWRVVRAVKASRVYDVYRWFVV
jgi:uncharacterized protein (TIGR03546 family)